MGKGRVYPRRVGAYGYSKSFRRVDRFSRDQTRKRRNRERTDFLRGRHKEEKQVFDNGDNLCRRACSGIGCFYNVTGSISRQSRLERVVLLRFSSADNRDSGGGVFVFMVGQVRELRGGILFDLFRRHGRVFNNAPRVETLPVDIFSRNTCGNHRYDEF